MPYMISSRSVTDDVSLAVSKSKLVYSSLIFVDNKLTFICLLIQQQLATVSVHYTQVTLLIWRVLHLSGKTSRANGAYDIVNHFACNLAKCSPMVCQKQLLCQYDWSNGASFYHGGFLRSIPHCVTRAFRCLQNNGICYSVSWDAIWC